MLVLSRRIGERICIGDGIRVTVVRVHGDKVRLGIEAPPEVPVHREEVYERLQRGPGGNTVPPVADAATSVEARNDS